MEGIIMMALVTALAAIVLIPGSVWLWDKVFPWKVRRLDERIGFSGFFKLK